MAEEQGTQAGSAAKGLSPLAGTPLEIESPQRAGTPTQIGRHALRNRARAVIKWFAVAVVALWLFAALTLVALRWIDPPTTAVQMERRVQSWIDGKPYHERYEFVPLSQISLDFQHAVIAAEDARFYQHHGFDWQAIEIAAEGDMDGKRIRGGSTITQQLVKNLFFGTGRSFLRKGAEFTLVPVAEFVLGKRRILELYLNVVEWGPGIYGAEAASRAYYATPARNIGRDQGARLAAILPLPLKRRPNRMDHYSEIILERMREMGW
ncbi:MAG: monofunctional biosynthetic peptidoglycan transglycosylase [Terracidiphilus sp.]